LAASFERVVHGQQPGLEPGGFEEVLRFPITGERNPVDSETVPIRKPPYDAIQQQTPEPDAAGIWFHVAGVKKPEGSPIGQGFDVAHCQSRHHAVESANQQQSVRIIEQLTKPGNIRYPPG
jgi:hypothetical protein